MPIPSLPTTASTTPSTLDLTYPRAAVAPPPPVSAAAPPSPWTAEGTAGRGSGRPGRRCWAGR